MSDTAEGHEESTAFRLRPAGPDDAVTLASLILELAEFEKLSDEASPQPQRLAAHLADTALPRCEAILAERSSDGEAVGFALYFQHYSTFLTRWGIYLEDLYVRPSWRGQGVGFALLRAVAAVAAERGCERLEWAVLDWNQPAIDFYLRIGAEPLESWTTMRLGRDAIRRLA